MSAKKVMGILQANQVGLAYFVGVSQPTVHQWVSGKAQPKGLNRAVLNIAMMIGRDNPELLRTTAAMPLPFAPLQRVLALLEAQGGIEYWLDITTAALEDEKNSEAMGRLAVMLGAMKVFMPDLLARLIASYPDVVTRNRQTGIARAVEQEAKIKKQRADRAKNRRALAGLDPSSDDRNNFRLRG